jgi:hypothetical protein
VPSLIGMTLALRPAVCGPLWLAALAFAFSFSVIGRTCPCGTAEGLDLHARLTGLHLEALLDPFVLGIGMRLDDTAPAFANVLIARISFWAERSDLPLAADGLAANSYLGLVVAPRRLASTACHASGVSVTEPIPVSPRLPFGRLVQASRASRASGHDHDRRS